MFNIIISVLLGITFIVFVAFLIKEKKFFLKNSSVFYIPLLMILFAIHIYALKEENVLILSYEALKDTLGAIGFDADISKFDPEKAIDALFIINYYFLSFFIGYITISVVVDLIFSNIVNVIKLLFIKRNSILVLMEDSDEEKLFLKSVKRKYVIIDKKNEELEKYLLGKRICYLVGINKKNLKRFKGKSTIVSFLDDADNQFKAINLLADINNTCYFKASSDVRYALDEIIKDKSHINLFSKYELIADQFILKHSISKYLDDSMIDRKTLLLKNGVDINTFMIGFGKVNSAIYLELIKNNQFAKKTRNKINTYTSKYYIYSKDETDTSNLNHNLRRIRYVEDKSDYYPWPIDTFSAKINSTDINSYEYYKSIKSSLALSGLNVFVIALGDDLTNIDMALKLRDRINSWELKSKSIIFVRIKKASTNNFNLPSDIVVFGSDKDVINKDVIINDAMLTIAKKRAGLYAESNDIEGVWKNLPLAKRLSNKNAVFSIIHKLGLLGLEIDTNIDDTKNKKNKNEVKIDGISKEEYYNLYDKDNEIVYENDEVKYPLTFSKALNPRNTLAYLEHNRWTTEMIAKGYIPYKKSLVHVKDGKIVKDDLDKKLHVCITTFDGLDMYFNDASLKLEEALKISHEEAYKMVENKRYDYELMDEAYSLLSNISYSIKKL